MAKQTKYKQLSAELNDILANLQVDDLDVDEAIQLYERGIAVTKQLEQYLSEAENTLTEIQKANEE